MAHEILQQPKIVTAIGERVPGAMAKHVRPHVAKTCASSRLRDEVVHGLAGHGLPAEQPRQLIGPVR